ncbi:MAG: PEGA domain-containing protein [Ignavibacterium sp.]|uniref:PEGA domain-containing protein n=1 Tax=Ignavibacterium sp. TaxID=2651167 RepID=UPI00404B0C0B
MNLLTKMLMILFFVNLFLQAQDCKNILRIISDKSEVNIFVNDSLVSSNGQAELEISDGEYEITASESDESWNEKTFTDSIFLSNCETKIIHYYFNAETLIETIPSDVYVYSNDSLLGFTPIKIPTNIQELKLSKPGYVQKEIKIEEKPVQLVQLEFNGTIKSEPFVKTTLFKVLTGSAIALGAITAYFKLKADDKFDEYRFSGNKKFLDETNRYDTISGISLALFQINFGYIIYRFLAE